jgi:PIN domain nuclease of toxin-antitoxin system
LTTRLLLDTRIASWLDNGDDRLRPPTLELIEGRWRKGGTVLISAVATWEIAQLVFTRRISLDCPVETWIERFTDHPGIEPVSLTHDAAARAYQYSRSNTGT